MQHVLTLIAPPRSVKLRARTLVLNQLRAHLNPVRTVWLSEDACDLLLAYPPAPHVVAAIEQLALAEKIDIVLQPYATREKRLLISDMDSTMIAQECIDELAALIGIKPQVAAITERAMNGELDFPSALRERVALLKGMKTRDLEATLRDRITLTPGARILVQTMKQRGATTLLVSGGFTFFTSRIGQMIGFDADEANTLLIEHGELTGQTGTPILDKEAKRASLLRIAAEKNIPLSATLAVGDGANDLPMLLEAGLGIAYHAKPIVEASARSRIRYNDLTALLYAQGISKEHWVIDN